MWYGLACGLSEQEAMTMRLGALLDLMAIYQIKHEGARPRLVSSDDAEIIPDVT